jgi:hypothetical protein
MLVTHVIYISSSHNVGLLKLRTWTTTVVQRNLVMTVAQSSFPFMKRQDFILVATYLTEIVGSNPTGGMDVCLL